MDICGIEDRLAKLEGQVSDLQDRVSCCETECGTKPKVEPAVQPWPPALPDSPEPCLEAPAESDM